jgi:acid phosphatase type 7
LFESFEATGVYPHLILAGHVHNYQRFTVKQQTGKGEADITCVVAGAGGYSKLGKLHKIGKKYPPTPMTLTDTLKLEKYDQDNFGFLRLEVTKQEITGTYFSAPYQEEATPKTAKTDQFSIAVRALG